MPASPLFGVATAASRTSATGNRTVSKVKALDGQRHRKYSQAMKIPSFDDAIRAPGEKLLAWDVNTRDGEHTLSIFSLAEGGAIQTAWRRALPDDVEAVTLEFEAQGFKVGHYDYHGPFVWHVSEAEIHIWDRERQVLHAHDDVI